MMRKPQYFMKNQILKKFGSLYEKNSKTFRAKVAKHVTILDKVAN